MAFKWLTKFMEDLAPEGSEDAEGRHLHKALAVLMLEVAQSDFSESDEETATLRALLSATTTCGENDVEQLLADARVDKEQSAGLYQFTRLACENMPPEQRAQLVEHLWQIAYADGIIDKYEEAAIRKVSELMYVPHADFIKAKLAAEQRR